MQTQSSLPHYKGLIIVSPCGKKKASFNVMVQSAIDEVVDAETLFRDNDARAVRSSTDSPSHDDDARCRVGAIELFLIVVASCVRNT